MFAGGIERYQWHVMVQPQFKNRFIFAHLHINSIRNKAEMLKEVISYNTDISLISETKLDNTFPLNELILEVVAYLGP